MANKTSFYNGSAITSNQTNAIQSSVESAKASEDAALVSKDSAAASASTATTQASAASSSASLASGHNDTAVAQAGISTTKAGEASASASSASTSAGTATTQAGISTTKAGEAAQSSTDATAAKTAAEAARDAAVAAKNAIDGLYLGAQSSDPSVDGLGASLTSGDWYFNTTSGVVRIYSGSAFVNGSVDGSLYATAAQGTLAASATQPSDLATVATSGGYADLSGKPTLGTAAATAATAYATAAQGATADAALPKAGGTLTGDTKLMFGDSGTFIHQQEDGALTTQSDGATRIKAGSTIFLMGTNSSTLATFSQGGSSVLHHSNSGKISTTSTGVNVTGNIAVTGTVDGRDVSADGIKANTAHSWGNHASASYATAAQGTKADTAHGWGNHASAGYTTAAAAESSALALAIALG